MQLTIEVPDALAEDLLAAGKDPTRSALEGLAIEGYCSRKLSREGVRQLLGFDTSIEVHQFLGDHHVDLNYSLENWQEDKETVARSVSARKAL